MKKTILKSIKFLALGFALLFVLRVAYGFLNYPTRTNTNWQLGNQQNTSLTNAISQSKRNYASKKIIRQSSSGVKAPMSVDQKYEKIASVSSKSTYFVQSENRARKLIKDFNALIQFEQKSGLKGGRYLHLAIGVDPTMFEAMTDSLSKIGKLVAFRVDKVDKTSEFKNLQTQKISLEKNLNNLISFKSQGGKLEELIKLEGKILEMEEKIQALGLNLGEFDEENEFCTVKYTLEEYKERVSSISFSHRLKVAFEWTIEYYGYLLGLLLMASVVSLVGATIVRLIAPLVEKHMD